MLRFHLLLVFSLLLTLAGCGSEAPVYLPKPRGYPRIELPEHSYTKLEAGYPYTFEHATRAKIVPDTSFLAQQYRSVRQYWIELDYPELDASIHVSFVPLRNNRDTLAAYFSTSSRLTKEHWMKAESIEDYVATTNTGYTAIVSELEGNTPSYLQWFVTDSTENFLRAALYFPVATESDSLRPVIDYMKDDMLHMLNSVEWAEPREKTW